MRRVRVGDAPARLTKELVNNKPGYFYKLGGQAYYIEPQVSLGPADGVVVCSKADFLFRPARAKSGLKPVAVFMDGFFYHKKRVGQDMAQRCAIAQSGRFHVWSLTWKDLQHQYKNQGNYFQNYLSLSGTGRTKKFNELLDTYGIEKLIKLNSEDSFDWLIQFLSEPDERRWRYHAFVHGLLHLDLNRFAQETEKQLWRDQLQELFPEEITMPVEELQPPCLYGLYDATPDNGEDFLRWFVAINQEALRDGQTEGMYMACCLLDDPSRQEGKAFEAAWNGFLRCFNLFQFIKQSFFATTEGKSSGQPYEALIVKAETAKPADADEWAEIKELTDATLHGLIDLLSENGWAVPEPGYELAEDSGKIIAEAELAWPDLKIALLRPEHMPTMKCFSDAGWRIIEIDAALADTAAFLQMRAA